MVPAEELRFFGVCLQLWMIKSRNNYPCKVHPSTRQYHRHHHLTRSMIKLDVPWDWDRLYKILSPYYYIEMFLFFGVFLYEIENTLSFPNVDIYDLIY